MSTNRTVVHLVPTNSVTGAESLDLRLHRALLCLEPGEPLVAVHECTQELRDQSAYRAALLGGSDPGLPVDVLRNTHGDVLHSLTVTRFHSGHVDTGLADVEALGSQVLFADAGHISKVTRASYHQQNRRRRRRPSMSSVSRTSNPPCSRGGSERFLMNCVSLWLNEYGCSRSGVLPCDQRPRVNSDLSPGRTVSRNARSSRRTASAAALSLPPEGSSRSHCLK